MKPQNPNSLFHKEHAAGILARIASLHPNSRSQWGKMNVSQMLAHCTVSLETTMGLNAPKKLPLPLRIIGRLMKGGILSSKPMTRNSATDKSYIITDERDFETERVKVVQRIQSFCTGGAAGCTTSEHVFFGKMQPNDWALMQWKHFDHHLRQFGA
jgi:hypothetical protein